MVHLAATLLFAHNWFKLRVATVLRGELPGPAEAVFRAVSLDHLLDEAMLDLLTEADVRAVSLDRLFGQVMVDLQDQGGLIRCAHSSATIGSAAKTWVH